MDQNADEKQNVFGQVVDVQQSLFNMQKQAMVACDSTASGMEKFRSDMQHFEARIARLEQNQRNHICLVMSVLIILTVVIVFV